MTRTKEQRRTSAVRIDDIERMFGERRSQHVEETLELQVGGESRRTDADWTVPRYVSAECISGKLVIDFTQALCSRREIDVRVDAGSGTIVLVVPRGWRVDLDGVKCGDGAIANRVKLPRFPGAPLIRVVGHVDSGVLKARYDYRSPIGWLRRAR
ncbi:hypothetical protein [Nocardia jejuensis]|uniref:hypothetical protein n=1 Tax=Nocardia jejuensis TaxID=328049 RepID=UPI0008367D49|nr:hypothetical protein [Nocardia jejuensis]